MTHSLQILTSQDDTLDQLCEALVELASNLDQPNAWPAEQLQLCAQYGVFRWFVPTQYDGLGWSQDEIVRGYLKLASACLTTTFVMTQCVAACRRIAGTSNESLKKALLPEVVSGAKFTTVGISHLTTSHRHLSKPVLKAEVVGDGFCLNGFSPWVTGAGFADQLVIGATLADGDEILVVVDRQAEGVTPRPGMNLVALSASQTGAVDFENVFVANHRVLAGPSPKVLSLGSGGGAGGLQTSALATGLTLAAVNFLQRESQERDELRGNFEALSGQVEQQIERLESLAAGEELYSTEEVRTEANRLVLRATQSALVAAKGAGFVASHPVGRWCRESLFFLVWSCPQPVWEANLCEFAGINS